MCRIQVYCVMGRQYIGKTGKSSVTVFDLENSRELSITLQNGALADEDVANKSPRWIEFTGVEARRGDGGLYLTCESLHVVDQSAGRKAAAS